MEEGWVTTGEAAQILGIDPETMRRRCQAGRYRTRREWRQHNLYWLIDRDQVEAERDVKDLMAKEKAAGKKWCPGCQQWLELAKFYKHQGYCIACQKARKNSAWAPPSEQLSGPVADYVGPSEPKDATIYQCLTAGFHHKPLPMNNGQRMSKREAFCPDCKAKRCHFHPLLTPKELVRRYKLTKGRIAAGM